MFTKGMIAMDPNEALEELRRLLSSCPDEAHTLALRFGAVQAHFEALDEWLSKGG